LSQEQVVAAIVILLLIVFALAPSLALRRGFLGLVRSISILGISVSAWG
jgi:hypothetical protein